MNFNTGKVVRLNLKNIKDKGLSKLLNAPITSYYQWNGAIQLGSCTKILLNSLDSNKKFIHYIVYFDNESGDVLYSKSFKEMKNKYREKTPYLNPYTNKIYCVKVNEGKVKIISFKE
jgi:uncharacterized protein involved in tolerance to divalent cations